MGTGQLKERNRILENENADLDYLASQKDKKIQELERNCQEMRQKLQQVLKNTQHENSTEIQKVFNNSKDPESHRAQF